MKAEGDGLPFCENSAKGLGVRESDVTLDAIGMVVLGSGGMSVFPSIGVLAERVARGRFPARMVPRRLRPRIEKATGSDDRVVYRIGEGGFEFGAIADQLQLAPDSTYHGTIQPSVSMTLAEFRTRIQATREEWVDGEAD